MNHASFPKGQLRGRTNPVVLSEVLIFTSLLLFHKDAFNSYVFGPACVSARNFIFLHFLYLDVNKGPLK